MSTKNKYDSYKYFMYSMLEYFKNKDFKLEEINFGSIRQLLNDYIEVYNQIKSNAGDSAKLKRSLDALKENILFYFNNTNISKHKFINKDVEKIKNILKKEDSSITDVQKIKQALEETDTSEIDLERIKQIVNKPDNSMTTEAYLSLTAFVKKMNNVNILDLWIDILESEYTKSFDDIDKLMDCYISELLFEGYSLKYLEEFWLSKFKNLKNCTDEDNILVEVEKFRELSNIKDSKYDILLNLNIPTKLKEELENGEILNIDKIVYKMFNACKSNEKLIEEIESKSFFKSNKAVTLRTVVKAPDKYRAMHIGINKISNYLEVYKVIDTSIKNNNTKLALLDNTNKYIEYNVKNFTNYSRELSSREKEDIVDFIGLREYFRKNNIKSASINDIENIINILQKLNELTIENRLLNCWSSLESITRFYKESSSNINTVNSIIPKVISMYIIKQKMNCLWDRIYPLIKKGILKDDRLNACISDKNNKKYNKVQFATYLLKEDTAKWLYENTTTNIIICRKIAEINNYLKNPSALETYVEFKMKCIENNINSIYRLRNNLVHSGGSVNINMENYTQRLQYYLNCILGTLIYHMTRNPDLTISEVLYSIITSHKEYMNNIKELKGKVKNIKGKEKEDIIKREEIITEYGVGNIAFIKYLYI